MSLESPREPVFIKPPTTSWRRFLRWPGFLLFGLAVWVFSCWAPSALVVPSVHWWHNRDRVVFPGPKGSTADLRLSSDGKTLYRVSGHGDKGVLQAWDIDSCQLRHEVEATRTLVLSADGDLL